MTLILDRICFKEDWEIELELEQRRDEEFQIQHPQIMEYEQFEPMTYSDRINEIDN